MPNLWATGISIIIDDLGNHRNDLDTLNLDPKIILSLLPDSPYAPLLAQRAATQGRTIMLHIPMQGSRDELDLGVYGLDQNLSESVFKQRLKLAMLKYPNASGLNNHMGSVLTQQAKAMHWLMQVLQEQGYFFVDSRTHANSIAEDIAKQYQVPTIRRHVFLDHIAQPQAIALQWQRALALAEKQTGVVVIAHPKQASLAFLRTLKLPQDVALVPLYEQLHYQPAISSEPNPSLLTLR